MEIKPNNIYIYGVVRNKYHHTLSILLIRKNAFLIYCFGENKTQHQQPTIYFSMMLNIVWYLEKQKHTSQKITLTKASSLSVH